MSKFASFKGTKNQKLDTNRSDLFFLICRSNLNFEIVRNIVQLILCYQQIAFKHTFVH